MDKSNKLDKKKLPETQPRQSNDSTNQPITTHSLSSGVESSTPYSTQCSPTPEQLAARLEGRLCIKPNPKEYAKYDQQRVESARLAKIAQQLKKTTLGPSALTTAAIKQHAASKEGHDVNVHCPAVFPARQADALVVRSSGLDFIIGPHPSSEPPLDDSAITLSMRRAITAIGLTYIKPLGRGTYGNVVLATKTDTCSSNDEQIAIKVINLDTHDPKFIRRVLRRELHVLSTLPPHAHLMRVQSIHRVDRSVLFCMQLANNGDLYDYVHKHGYLSEPSACRVFYQLCSAVQHLHTHGFAHRDIKCENILLDKSFNVKLTDFGFTFPLWSMGKVPALSALNAQLACVPKEPIVLWKETDFEQLIAQEDQSNYKKDPIQVNETKERVNLTINPERLHGSQSPDCTYTSVNKQSKLRTCILDEHNVIKFTQTHCGSLLYACPEVLNRELYDPRAADVWSLGVVLWVILFNCYPYESEIAAVQALRANTCVFELPQRPVVGEHALQLIKRMLVKEDFRVHLADVLECEWITQHKANFATMQLEAGSGQLRVKSLAHRQHTGTFDL